MPIERVAVGVLFMRQAARKHTRRENEQKPAWRVHGPGGEWHTSHSHSPKNVINPDGFFFFLFFLNSKKELNYELWDYVLNTFKYNYLMLETYLHVWKMFDRVWFEAKLSPQTTEDAANGHTECTWDDWKVCVNLWLSYFPHRTVHVSSSPLYESGSHKIELSCSFLKLFFSRKNYLKCAILKNIFSGQICP